MPLHLHIDPFSGIAGDMFIGAMLDLGLDLDRLRLALTELPVDINYSLSAERVLRQGIAGTDFKVHTSEPAAASPLTGRGGAHHHHHARYPDIVAMIDRLDTTPRGKARARKIVDALAHAEALVHRMPVEQVHFHEVGAVDSIIDMLGSAVAMELLGVETVSCGPVPISRGFVRCQHGRMPVPAPATAFLLRGMATVGVDRTGELVTPTGAAILAAVCDRFGPPPPMRLEAVGYGAGDRDEPEVPNLLRLFLGETTVSAANPQMQPAYQSFQPLPQPQGHGSHGRHDQPAAPGRTPHASHPPQPSGIQA